MPFEYVPKSLFVLLLLLQIVFIFESDFSFVGFFFSKLRDILEIARCTRSDTHLITN